MTTTTGANSRTPFNNMVHYMYKDIMPQLITKREGHNTCLTLPSVPIPTRECMWYNLLSLH